MFFYAHSSSDKLSNSWAAGDNQGYSALILNARLSKSA